ncbi:MAG: hypothetical protein V3U20_00855 [Thermoplasmata archaeon]
MSSEKDSFFQEAVIEKKAVVCQVQMPCIIRYAVVEVFLCIS